MRGRSCCDSRRGANASPSGSRSLVSCRSPPEASPFLIERFPGRFEAEPRPESRSAPAQDARLSPCFRLSPLLGRTGRFAWPQPRPRWKAAFDPSTAPAYDTANILIEGSGSFIAGLAMARRNMIDCVFSFKNAILETNLMDPLEIRSEEHTS